MRIYNGTAHKICIYSLDQCDQTDPRKLIILPEQNPVFEIEAGTNLNCVKVNAPLTGVGDFPFPVKGAVSFSSYDPLPEGYDLYVVSNLYRSAVVELGGNTAKLATVDGVVYENRENPRPCGCLGLAIG